MTIVRVIHHVRDFEAWKPVFDQHQAVREQHGAEGHALFRDSSDPNLITVVNRFATAEGAHAFAQHPSLPEAMQRAGVDSQPGIAFLEMVEDVQYTAARA